MAAATNAEPDECVRHVLAASSAENEAIELDRANNRAAALEKYKEAVREFQAAIAVALPDHAEDRDKLTAHKNEVQSRIHLLTSSPATSIPVEDQIKSVQLAMAGASAASNAAESAGGVKKLAAVAAVGAVGGAVVLGGALGLTTVGIVGGAAGAAYCATRQDKVGDLARKTGDVALKGVDRVQELNREHQITAKIAEAGRSTVTKAKEVNASYGITDKIAAGASKATAKAREIEEKHKVTDKVASGISKGLDGVSKLLGGSKSSAAGSAPAPK